MSIPTLTVRPASAADAYARVQNGDSDQSETGNEFSGVLARAIQGVVDTGHQADAESVKAISGAGNITELATAVSRAELALQTAIAIRDRVVQAYQDVSRMSI